MTLKELIENPKLLDEVRAQMDAQTTKPEPYDWEGLGELIEEHPIVGSRRVGFI